MLHAIALRFPLIGLRAQTMKNIPGYKHIYIWYIMHAIHTRIQYVRRTWYTCTQSLCLPIITAWCAVAFSSGGQKKHKLWWELLLQLENTHFQFRLFNTPPTSPDSLSLGLWVLWWWDWDRLRQSFKRPCQTHKGQVSFTLIQPVRP